MKIRWTAGAAAIVAGALTLLAAAQQTGLDPAVVARAQAGEPAAQVELGQAYAAGKGVAQDGAEAALWLRKAAEQGSLDGEKALGALYRDGAGKKFPRDTAQAVGWYRKAAERGDVEAQGMLGVFYSFGQGVAQDYVEAYFWLDLAAAVAGPKQAQYASNRQLVGQHITADELEAIQDRVAKWKAAHPR
jgi:TPR repeat protein